MKSKTSLSPTVLPIATAWGNFTAGYTKRGLAALSFPPESGIEPSAAPTEAVATAEIRRWHALTTKAVQAALAGKPLPALPPLDLTTGTPFQKSVWQALQGIAAGRTQSYGEIAVAIGRPKASRAVGAACGANPIPVLIPCHRVLAAGGGLGGFTAGLDWKRRLLTAERVGTLASGPAGSRKGLQVES